MAQTNSEQRVLNLLNQRIALCQRCVGLLDEHLVVADKRRELGISLGRYEEIFGNHRLEEHITELRETIESLQAARSRIKKSEKESFLAFSDSLDEAICLLENNTGDVDKHLANLSSVTQSWEASDTDQTKTTLH